MVFTSPELFSNWSKSKLLSARRSVGVSSALSAQVVRLGSANIVDRRIIRALITVPILRV
jgi:hypothetical protein